MKTYDNYIKNKRVIFVGACPNIKGKCKRKEIDDYDIVVRSNNSIELIKDEKFNIDYGKKCNVLYINNQYYRNMRPLPITKYRRQGIKWLCVKNIRSKDRLKYQKRVQVRTIHESMMEVGKKLLSGSMGSFLVYDILTKNPKELFLTGIDFFASRKPVFEHDNYREYIKGYLPDKIREEGNRINVGKTEDGHDFYGNAKFIYDLFQNYKNLYTEDFILEILYKIINNEIKQGDITWQ